MLFRNSNIYISKWSFLQLLTPLYSHHMKNPAFSLLSIRIYEFRTFAKLNRILRRTFLPILIRDFDLSLASQYDPKGWSNCKIRAQVLNELPREYNWEVVVNEAVLLKFSGWFWVRNNSMEVFVEVKPLSYCFNRQ